MTSANPNENNVWFNICTYFFFQQSSEGTITFKLVPSFGKGGSRESKVRVRALFDYDSLLDTYIPCKEAGLNFSRGDILHIVSQDDAYW